MNVGENVVVKIETATDDKKISTAVRAVRGVCIWVHPQGRFARVRVPAGYTVTVYPSRRAGDT